ncbi:MAG: hypothetical protein WD827_07010 [Solirubrobacterales bacterium]
MRADYDSEGDTIQIELEQVRKLGHGEDVDGGAAIVGVHEGRPVCIDILSARRCGVEAPLRAAAERYDLDAEVLIAAAQAALAVPDRTVTLDVGIRAVA